MLTTVGRLFALLCASLAASHGHAAEPAEGCSAFTWNLSQEFILLRAPATAVAAAPTGRQAGVLEVNRHYLATLVPQQSVSFVLPPSRAAREAQPLAGLFTFKPKQAGRFRIGLNSRHWIDVLDGTNPINSSAHEGKSGCQWLHKVVEFSLPAERTLIIQLSGQSAANVDLVITGPISPESSRK